MDKVLAHARTMEQTHKFSLIFYKQHQIMEIGVVAQLVEIVTAKVAATIMLYEVLIMLDQARFEVE
jgi:hypothetical protein